MRASELGVFGIELMSPFLSSAFEPISAMSVAALADLGFMVNSAASDDFTMTGAMQSITAGASLPPRWKQLLPMKYELLRNGQVRELRVK